MKFKFRLPVPPINRQPQIVSILTAAMRRLSLLSDEIAGLSRQKRDLMQKLSTSEWRVNTNSQAETLA